MQVWLLNCRKGEEYEAKMEMKSMVDAFNLTFTSPVTAGRDGHFLRLAHATGTDKVTGHRE